MELKTTYKQRQQRYTDNEIYLITLLIKNKIDIDLWNGDTIRVNQEENLITRISNEYGEEILCIFNHIEQERISNELKKIKE